MPTAIDAIDDVPGAQTLRRGLAVLKLLTRVGPGGLRMSEIGRRLGLNKTTAARLTRALLDESFISHDPATRTYRLGPEAFAVGLAAEPSYVLQRLAAPRLRALALECGDWVFFSVLHGNEAVCLSREEGDIPIPMQALKVGDRVPLGVGAGGLAILAALPEAEAEAALAANAPLIERNYPRCTLPVIRAALQETRDKGFSLVPGLIVDGYWAMGVAVINGLGRPEAAISLVASEARMQEARRSALAARMVKMCQELRQSACSTAASVG
jgi:DNA-binding IclR family transcriptional regulator